MQREGIFFSLVTDWAFGLEGGEIRGVVEALVGVTCLYLQ